MLKKILYVIPIFLIVTSIVFFENFLYLLSVKIDGGGVGVNPFGIELKILNEQILLYQVSFIVIAILLLTISVFSFLKIKKITT